MLNNEGCYEIYFSPWERKRWGKKSQEKEIFPFEKKKNAK